MLKELLKEMLKLQRPEQQSITKYGNYSSKDFIALYSDYDKHYHIKEECERSRGTSNYKSFAAFINEECKRRGNKTGEKSTAVITNNGGHFIADTDFDNGHCDFSRAKSQQWITLSKNINQTLDHEEFLFFLQKLSPSIENFPAKYRNYSSLRLIGNSTLESTPIFTNGEGKSGYTVNFKLEGGASDSKVIDNEITCNLPYAKGSEVNQKVPLEFLVLNNKNNKVEIRIICPTFEKIEEDAISAETELLKTEIKGLTDLLILENY